jgi:predicted GNAT family N-acyltransferase
MPQIVEQHWGDYAFSTDRTRLNIAFVHQFIAEQSYWAKGVPLETVKCSIENSLCIGVYRNEQQIGFARLVTDYATFAYLADVFIDEAHRGKGLSKRLMEFIHSIQELKYLRRIVLVTRDAHTLYAQYGFKPLATPEKYMELHRPDVYVNV